MNRQFMMAAVLMAMPVTAMAVPIVGEIGLGGNLQAYCSGGDPICDFSNADGIDYGNNGFGTSASMVATFANGDFAADGIGIGSFGTINDFLFNPLTPSPVNPLWTITGNASTWAFSLESVTIVMTTDNFINLTGTGILSGTGFDDTMGTWSFSADEVGSEFSWSSTNAPTISEPGALVLFGIGLLGMASRRILR